MNVKSRAHRSLGMVALGGLLAAMTPAEAGAENPAVRKALEGEYAKFVRAFRSKDAKGAQAHMADDYRRKDANGTIVTKQQIIREQAGSLNNFQTITKQTVTIQSITGSDSSPVATTKAHLEGTLKDPEGRMGPKGKVHTIIFDGVYIDHWTKTAAGWKVKMTEISTPPHVVIDGKQTSPPGKK